MCIKLAYIGGGSLFVPSIINGIAQVLRSRPAPFEVDLALYDIQRPKAERMQAYAHVARKFWQVPLHAHVVGSRVEALEGADVVIISAWLQDEHEQVEKLWQQLGFKLPEEGPGLAAWAVACAPWSLQIAAEMRQLCPEALLVTLMNPTDVIAGLILEAGGVAAVGMCVEVDGLRGGLAYYFNVPYESITLRHAGINHDGWILDLNVAGEDGYQLWRSRWGELQTDLDYHPGTRGIIPIINLTGHLRSSAYHNWPYMLDQTPEEIRHWEKWQGKRERYNAALDEAIHTGEPISDPPGIHPERSRLNYPYTGLTFGRLLQSLAGVQMNVIPLQVLNRGVISNFPGNVMVEVPTQVQGQVLTALPVGDLPDWLCGYTRLLAIQRRLLVEYILDRQITTLKRAMAVLPVFGTVKQLNLFAETLHQWF